MGYLESSIHAISRIRFGTMNEGVSVDRLVKASRGITYVLTKLGSVVTDGGLGKSVSLMDYTNEAVKALVALDLVTKAEAKAHRECMRHLQVTQDRHGRVEQFNRLAVRFGIELTPAQNKRLGMYRAEGKQAHLDLLKRVDALNAKRAEKEAAEKLSKEANTNTPPKCQVPILPGRAPAPSTGNLVKQLGVKRPPRHPDNKMWWRSSPDTPISKTQARAYMRKFKKAYPELQKVWKAMNKLSKEANTNGPLKAQVLKALKKARPVSDPTITEDAAFILGAIKRRATKKATA